MMFGKRKKFEEEVLTAIDWLNAIIKRNRSGGNNGDKVQSKA